MECPECGSQYPVEKIGFDENASKDKRGFQISNPNLFPYYSKSRYYFLSYTMISWSYVISSWLLLGFVIMFFVANFYVGLIFSSSGLLFSYFGYDYYNKANNKIDDLEKKYISRLLDSYYCGVDEIVFDESGDILDHKEDIRKIKNALNEHDLNGGFANIRYMMASGLVFSICLLSMPFLNFPDSDQKKGTTTEKSERVETSEDISKDKNKVRDSKKESEENLISREKVDVGSIQLGPRLLDPGEVNGRYSFPVGKGLDISVVFVTWNKFEDMGVDVPNKYDKKYNEYDGLFYAYESSEAGLLLGAWKLSNRMIDGFRQKFVFLNAAKFRDGSVGDKDFGILYGEGEGPSLAIHVRGNRFFSAYPKKNLPRSRSFYSD